MGPSSSIRAWRPPVPGVAEVLHAHFPHHAYPSHTHDTWTLLVVDTGAVRFGLDRHEHGALRNLVTLLPPHVPHDGRSVDADGFRKRVIYLEADQLDVRRIGAAVDHPGWADPPLRHEVHRLHEALRRAGDSFEAESRLALVCARLEGHLAGLGTAPPAPDRTTARRLRELLDARVVEGVALSGAGQDLGVSASHLVRSFSAEYGIAPHRYLTGRRIDRARRLLLAGHRAADVAVAVGFHDQAHLTRHFKRLLGVTPGAFARSASVPAGRRRRASPRSAAR
ncbi:AraC family transcriptional regulator [Nocardioides sp.]|uniref:helix-turn-helix transcriptional regulator n=1 Tax=Nocardioides sp. TaxID=35761 RepID=UPI0027332A55|nr:AraC family transcriptional regulator [Nocardioides sp.]MDP3889864.1 AraC family transcriptional regulator [Nocardioides sp.]